MRLITPIFVVAPRPMLMLMFVLTLAGCAGSDPKAPKEALRMNVSVVAAADVNPDERRRAAPIVVRVYELKNDGTFDSADFFSLQQKDKTLLADDLVARDEFLLRPGERKTIERKSDPASTALGIVAAYRDLPNSVWRAIYPLPSAPDAAWYRFAPKLNLTVDLQTNAIKVTRNK